MITIPGLNERTTSRLQHVAGAAVLAVVVGVVYAMTGVSSSSGSDDEPDTRSADLARLRTLHAQTADVKRRLDVVQQRVDDLRRQIPRSAGEREVLGQLVEIAAQTGLTIRDYESGMPIDEGGHKKLLIHLSAFGPYFGICRFLDRVDRLERLATIESLDISAATDEEAYPVAMTVAVYFADRIEVDAENGGADG